MINEINAYRAQYGLSSVRANVETCKFAKIRAQEISASFSHDGFQQRLDNHTLPYPRYHLVTENLITIPNYRKAVNSWINSSGHAENMRKDTPFVCVEKYGDFYAYEGWKP